MPKDIGKATEKGIRTRKGNPRYPFYLGHDPKEARRRKVNLEAFWTTVAQEEGGKWTEWSLSVAKCIAKGQAVDVPAKPNDLGPYVHHQRILRLQQKYPMVIFNIPEYVQEALVDFATDLRRREGELRQEADVFRHEADVFRHEADEALSKTVTLFQAFDEFAKWIPTQSRSCVAGTGNLKPSGRRILNNLKLLKKHHADVMLADFAGDQIDAMQNYWESRPVVQSGKIAAFDTCQDAAKTILRFVRWLHKSSLPWRLPADYEFKRTHIQITPAEIAAKGPEQVDRFKIAEIKILWEYARPLERFYMLLGLNCGFGRAEVGSLYTSEIVNGYIKRVRSKTLVYGEWILWPETKRAIAWWVKHRAKSELPEFILTMTGRALSPPTKQGNMRSDISATWYRLLNRVAKDHAEYSKGGARRLPFNKLRKTSGNWVRKIAGGETMKIFHSRGKPVRGDEHSEVYSNRNFRRVHRAIKIMAKKLNLKAEWPDKVPQPATSMGKINRVRELRRQGFKIVKIAEITGLSRETVRKFIKQSVQQTA